VAIGVELAGAWTFTGSFQLTGNRLPVACAAADAAAQVATAKTRTLRQV
jgi:hypothetical protein